MSSCSLQRWLLIHSPLPRRAVVRSMRSIRASHRLQLLNFLFEALDLSNQFRDCLSGRCHEEEVLGFPPHSLRDNLANRVDVVIVSSLLTEDGLPRALIHQQAPRSRGARFGKLTQSITLGLRYESLPS